MCGRPDHSYSMIILVSFCFNLYCWIATCNGLTVKSGSVTASCMVQNGPGLNWIVIASSQLQTLKWSRIILDSNDNPLELTFCSGLEELDLGC